MFKFLRRWLVQSPRVHVRQRRVETAAQLIALIDGFLDDDLSYPLEWDDFVSWEQGDPLIEAERVRIAMLEPLFLSRDARDRNEATRLLMTYRNEFAASRGLPVRASATVTEFEQGCCDLHLQRWQWENEGRDLVLGFILPNGKPRQVRFAWARNVVIDLQFAAQHGGMPLTWDAKLVKQADASTSVSIDFGSTGEIRLVCSGITWTDVAEVADQELTA